MTRIGLLSDTHGYLDKRVLEHFADVDEIFKDSKKVEEILLEEMRGNQRYGIDMMRACTLDENGNLVTVFDKTGYTPTYEDLLPAWKNKAAIVVDTVDNREKSWIFELQIDNDTLFVTQYDRGEMYSEEYYQELLVKKIPVYDLR